MAEEKLILKKIVELNNENVRFIAVNIKNRPGQYGLLAQQGLQKIVLQAPREELEKFAWAIINAP